jgi:hypothetical protein
MPTLQLNVLQCGECETLKAGVHGSALALVAVMGLYNAAAWLRRRDGHLAVNAVLYAALVAWEQKHVAHHLRALKRVREAAAATPGTGGRRNRSPRSRRARELLAAAGLLSG